MVPGIIKAAADNQDLLAAVEAAAAAASSRRSSKKQNTNDLLSCMTCKSLAARLLSCMISCLKLTCAYIENKPENYLALQVAIDVALVAQKYAIAAAAAAAAAAATTDREEVASQHSISCSAAAVPWAHVVTRALYCCTTALLWPHTAGTAADRERAGEQDSSKAALLKKQQSDSPVAKSCVSESLLQQLSELVAWCHLQLQFRSSSSDSRASNVDRCSLQHTKARQMLQQKYEQLQQGLAAAVSLTYPAASRQNPQQQASNTGDAATDVKSSLAIDARRAISYQLCLDLQQYLAKLCALLPTRLCCNNPGCSNLGVTPQQQLSELSCVGRRKCSRCEVAGYCSKECQIQHWSQHKVLCRQICRVTGDKP